VKNKVLKDINLTRFNDNNEINHKCIECKESKVMKVQTKLKCGH